MGKITNQGRMLLIGSTCGSGGFACTFFGFARGIGFTRFYLVFPSFVESVSASSHKNYLLIRLPVLSIC